jgi:alkanesulfonate monooxygenase SsuD/methylene tetrahydromethanopterin reductase-like flavin-dependent oxidoreductase (luciferase family)
LGRNYTFGVVLPQGWRWLDDNGDTALEQYQFSKNIAELSDGLGYSSAYAYDHMRGGSFSIENHDKNFFESLVLLTSIIPNTKRLRIGQIVLSNSFRNPSLLAKMVSTMDVISNGRVELGIGAGWIEDEYLAYGYDYLSAVDRIRQLEESLCIIRKMWTEKKSTFQGKYYSIKDATCNPKPIQKPYPKIMVGGTGRHLLKVVAKHADRYNHPFSSPNDIELKLHTLKDHCMVVGRNYHDIELSVLIRCLLVDSYDDLNDVIKAWKKELENLGDFEKRISAIVGTPEDIITKINKYIDIGITHFIIHFIGLNENTIRLFDSKVIKKIG